MLDPWKSLREKLFGNVEPEVELIGLTCPGLPGHKYGFYPDIADEDIYPFVNNSAIESQVALAASVSSGVIPKDFVRLNKKLIEFGHHTPLEAIQFNFKISGISKAAGAQISRHRIGQGHVSSSRRYQEQEPAFIYPLLLSIKDEALVATTYNILDNFYRSSFLEYSRFRKFGISKGDARYLVPVSSAQERVWWINARALRDFFKLRLAPSAEGEIRRLAFMLLDIVYRITPSLFEDIYVSYRNV